MDFKLGNHLETPATRLPIDMDQGSGRVFLSALAEQALPEI
jgi:hypothetical protein